MRIVEQAVIRLNHDSTRRKSEVAEDTIDTEKFMSDVGSNLGTAYEGISSALGHFMDFRSLDSDTQNAINKQKIIENLKRARDLIKKINESVNKVKP